MQQQSQTLQPETSPLAWGLMAMCIVPGVAASLHTKYKYRQEQQAGKVDKVATVPWWRKGGMHVTEIGAIFTILGPFIVLGKPFAKLPLPTLLSSLLLAAGLLVSGIRTTKHIFTAVVMPCYVFSLGFIFMIAAQSETPLTTFAVMAVSSMVLVLAKIGVCMSVCLHRYFAHAAFRCHWAVNIALGWLSCLANQGGPLWWASQHRCHHKFCDQARDPHSALLAGSEGAFCFFDHHKDMNEEFVPAYCDTLCLRIIDTFAFVPGLVELMLAYTYLGPAGLYVSYTSAWMSQCITLWFNVAQHPPTMEPTCKASDSVGEGLVAPNVMFGLLNRLLWVPKLVGEEKHHHHHEYPRCGHRPGLDLPYWLFVKPLEMSGLIWQIRGEH